MARTVDLVTALRVGRDRLHHRALRACPKARAARKPSAHDLMPLDLAALTIFRRVYEERLHLRPTARLAAHLDTLAYTIAGLVPIYVYERAGRSLRPLSREELDEALFKDGAKGICYTDGRPSIHDLAISAKDVQAVIQTLLEP
jgi:hypothetical protein